MGQQQISQQRLDHDHSLQDVAVTYLHNDKECSAFILSNATKHSSLTEHVVKQLNTVHSILKCLGRTPVRYENTTYYLINFNMLFFIIFKYSLFLYFKSFKEVYKTKGTKFTTIRVVVKVIWTV